MNFDNTVGNRMNLPTTLSRLAGRRQAHSLGCSPISMLVAASFITAAAAADAIPEPDAEAKTEKEMKPYKQKSPAPRSPSRCCRFPAAPSPWAARRMKPTRYEDECPQHEVKIEPFWMGKYEVTWDEYDIWSFSLDQKIRKLTRPSSPTEVDKKADAVTRPTPTYTDMTFGMGHDGFPAICMTQLAAKTYCNWLSAEDRPLLPPADRSGVGIRLPRRHDHRLFVRRRSGKTRRLRLVLRQQRRDSIKRSARKNPIPGACTTCTATSTNGARPIRTKPISQCRQIGAGPLLNPLVVPTELYPRVVRGGSWDDDPADAARRRGARSERRLEISATRNSPRASGIIPTPSSSDFASCDRFACPSEKERRN